MTVSCVVDCVGGVPLPDYISRCVRLCGWAHDKTLCTMHAGMLLPVVSG